MSERNDGNPHQGGRDREGARLGQKRADDDIPKQGTAKSIAQVATYILGPPTRPPMTWDNGHLGQFPPRSPTAADYVKLAEWRAKLEGAEALRPDLTDGVAAYRHFLDGQGRPRQFSYERYVQNDTGGRVTLRNAILSLQWGVSELWRAHGKRTFSLTGTAISCGDKSLLFPYPATENWQKAIGGHKIWLSGDVTVSGGGTPQPHLNKAGTHKHAKGQLTIEKDGAVKVKGGDTLSGYSAAIHGGDLKRFHEFGRKQGNAVVPLANPNLIHPGETLYHIPTFTHYMALNGSNQPSFSAVMTLHAEDRYNFNPGQQDIATGIPDSANGTFEITGLGRQFDQIATLLRTLNWAGFAAGVTSAIDGSTERDRQPSNNVLPRNRI